MVFKILYGILTLENAETVETVVLSGCSGRRDRKSNSWCDLEPVPASISTPTKKYNTVVTFTSCIVIN